MIADVVDSPGCGGRRKFDATTSTAVTKPRRLAPRPGTITKLPRLSGGGGWAFSSPRCGSGRTRGPIELPSSELVGWEAEAYEAAIAEVRRRRKKDALLDHSPETPQRKSGFHLPRVHVAQPRYLQRTCVMHSTQLPIRREPPPDVIAESPSEPAPVVPEEVIEVVESPASMTVTSGDGATASKIPPFSWLVVEQGGTTPLVDEAVKQTIRLAKAANGGSVAVEGTVRLRKVPAGRLRPKAAEANFKRASQGSSLVALQHAALILRIYGRNEQAPPQLRCMDEYEPLDVALSAQEVERRVHLAEDMVSFREQQAAALRLLSAVAAPAPPASSSQQPQQERQQGQQPTPQWLQQLCGGGSSPSDDDGGQQLSSRPSLLERGWQAVLEFQRFAERRFGNTARLWFDFDTDERMAMSQKEFVRACVRVGFKGAILDVWRFCDRDSRGFIALEEVDHRAAKPLAVFHSFVLRTFGSSAEFFAALDTHRRGKVGRKEFVSKLVAMGMETPPPHLFELLIRAAHFSDLHSTDLTFLDKWEPPRFFIEDEDEELLRIFKQCVLELCPTLLKAWFKIVNRKMNMEWSIISWRCWLSSMSYLCKRCKRADAMLKTDLEVARVPHESRGANSIRPKSALSSGAAGGGGGFGSAGAGGGFSTSWNDARFH